MTLYVLTHSTILPPRFRRRPCRAAAFGAALLLCVTPFLGTNGTSVAAQIQDSGPFSALRARSIGPAGMSGRISAIAAVEADPNVVFVGAATGGLWRSANGGQTWTPLFDDQPVLGIGAVAVFQPDPEILWVGTGEGNPRNSAGVGAGVFRSTDGGESWSFLGLERSERIHRIVLHPSDPDVAYVGVMGPAWSDGEERGLYRTRDGGESWERVLYVDERTGIADLVMDPGNPDRILAATWEFRRRPWFFESGGPGSGLYRSLDGGDTWTRLTSDDGLPEGELGRMGLAVARSDPRVMYALVEASRSALIRSDDGGIRWRTVNDEDGVAPRPFYFADIVVDPEDESRIYNLTSRLRLSEDGGASFRDMASGVHSDFQALWIDPGDSRLMYVGTDGGVFVSRDRGDHWRLIENLPVGQFYHVAVDMDIPFNVYGGMQDNGSWRGPSDVWENGGIRNYHWQEVGYGDGFGTLPDPSDPSLGFSMSQAGGLVRFDLRTGERKRIRPWGPGTVPLRFNWDAPVAVDPFDPGTVYYGSQFLHKSTTRGESWEIVSPDLTTDDPEKQRQGESGGITPDVTGAENFTTLTVIAPSSVERELIWVGTDDGRVHLTRSRGGYWEDVGRRIRGEPDGAWVAHIEASKHHGGTAYVVLDDHRRGDWTPYIFRTENYGEDWRRIADEKQIRGFIHTLEEDPETPNLLFAGTEFGLYVSLDRGKEWFPWTEGVPSVPVHSLAIHPRDSDLVIGTHGRGIFILDDIRPLRALARDPSIAEAAVTLSPPPPAYLRNVAAVDGYHFAADGMFQGEARPPGALLTYWVGAQEGADSAEIRILGDSGRVIRRMNGPARPGANRMTWDLREDLPRGTGEVGVGHQGRFPIPEVLPGRYTVQVSVGGEESEAFLEVLPDPRVEIPLVDRIRKQQALRVALDLTVTRRVLEARREEVAAALDRVDIRLARSADSTADTLKAAVEAVRRDLGEVGAILSSTEGPEREVMGMTQTRDAPTEAERISLADLEDGVEEAIVRLNGLLVTRVRALSAALVAAGLEGIPEFRVVIRGGEP